MEKEVRNMRPTIQGTVVSEKMEKSVVVLVETHKRHPKYGKRVKYGKKYVAHDELNQAHVGDVVTIRGCRPLSKTKRFLLVSVDKLAPTPIKKVVEDQGTLEEMNEVKAPEVVETPEVIAETPEVVAPEVVAEEVPAEPAIEAEVVEVAPVEAQEEQAAETVAEKLDEVVEAEEAEEEK